MNITSLHTHILEASAAPENDAGVAEPGVQGVQLHTHYLLLSLIKAIHFLKKFMDITSLLTLILEASVDPENDAGAAELGVQGV